MTESSHSTPFEDQTDTRSRSAATTPSGSADAETGSRRLSRRHLFRLGLSAFGAAALGGSLYSSLSTRRETTRHDVQLGIPRPLRVVGVSDLHFDQDQGKYERLVESINAEKPDVVVIVGDSIDHRKGREISDLVPLLSKIRASRGQFATLGNWDYESVGDIDRIRGAFEAGGTRLLVNESLEIDGLRVVGVDDALKGSPDAELARSEIARGPTLLLTHCPEFFDRVVTDEEPGDRRVFAVAGHTHGGQIAPFGVSIFTPRGSGRFVEGWYGEPGRSLYVMRGIGFSGPHVRVGARPEMSVFDIA